DRARYLRSSSHGRTPLELTDERTSGVQIHHASLLARVHHGGHQLVVDCAVAGYTADLDRGGRAVVRGDEDARDAEDALDERLAKFDVTHAPELEGVD